MPKLLIYTLGDRAHGMGHVLRCLTLAEVLSARGVAVLFVTAPDTPGQLRLRQSGWTVYDFVEGDLSWTHRFPEARAALLDVEHGPPTMMLKTMRRYFDTIITVNGSGYTLQQPYDVRLYSDLIVYQSLLATPDAIVPTLAGAEYLMVHPDYAGSQPDREGQIVLSMGGADPHGMTLLAVQALDDLQRERLAIQGPAMTGKYTVCNEILDEIITVIKAPASLAPYLEGAALFVGALGMSAYEAAAAGVPALLTGWSADHVKTAKELETRGVCFSLGLWSEFDGNLLRGLAALLLSDREAWQKMSAAGKALIDGQGAARVADEIGKLIAGG